MTQILEFDQQAHDTPSKPVQVGVLIPCYNQGHFVAECVASLYRQTYPHWRAVVVDDASTDAASPLLCQEVASAKVNVVLLQKNLGRALVRNECLRQLEKVDYVLSIDCDDYLSDSFIEKLVNGLVSSPNAGMAYGTLHYFGDSGFGQEGMTFPSREWSRELMYLENVIPGSQAMFKYELLSKLPGWRADFTTFSGEDYDIWLQVVEAGWEPLWVKDAVYFYRQHGNSYMANRDQLMGLQVDLRILKHHMSGIKNSIGLDRFLNYELMPFIYGAIRDGEVLKALTFIRSLVRICPRAVVLLSAKYYWNRLVLRFRRSGKSGPDSTQSAAKLSTRF